MNDIQFRPQVRRYSQLPRFFRWFSDHCVVRQLDDSDIARVWRTVSHPSFGQCCTGRAPATNDAVVETLHAAQTDWRRGTRYAMAVLRKQSHDFVGWVELAPNAGAKDAWTVDAFLHPDFAATPLALEAFAATADLVFSALNAQKLYARSPAGSSRFDDLLNAHGFIQVAAAGHADPVTGDRRAHALYELGVRDWLTTGMRADLTLI
jgi:RimJ/RimL family protein N-acetyltransferase